MLVPCKHCGVSMERTNRGRREYCTDCSPHPWTQQAAYRLKTYDLTMSEFQAMYFDQDGECALRTCTREAVDVDHCHATGRVRALLCRTCNVQLGHLEMKDWYDSALEYLEEHK